MRDLELENTITLGASLLRSVSRYHCPYLQTQSDYCKAGRLEVITHIHSEDRVCRYVRHPIANRGPT